MLAIPKPTPSTENMLVGVNTAGMFGTSRVDVIDVEVTDVTVVVEVPVTDVCVADDNIVAVAVEVDVEVKRAVV